MKSFKKIAASGVAVATMFSMAACGSSDSSNEGTADNPVTINVWAWEPTLTPVAKAFEKKYPNIKVKITNAGTAQKQYTSINNALQAGKGAPDVAQIEYFAIPQFVLQNSLKDLTEFGADKFDGYYTPGPWASVTYGGGVHGLPIDSGPDAMFYNKETFDKAGITEAPKTWDEFYEAAKKIRAVGAYITCEPANIAVTEAWIWAAGGKTVTADGENVTINYADDSAAKKYYAFMQKLIDEDLIDTKLTMWSEEWYKALEDGTLATITTGAWMAAMLKDGVPTGEGKWRVAGLPQIDADADGNGEDGGSSLAVLAGSDKASAAYKFVEFAAHDREGVKIRIDKGQFPADTETMADEEFLNKTDPYFGDQKYQDVLVEGAKKVGTQWQFLPFEVDARTRFGDYVGKTVTGELTYQEAVEQWQDSLITYGNGQGFKVTKG